MNTFNYPGSSSPVEESGPDSSNIRFAYIFDNRYLYINRLGSGAQAVAQRVLQLSTGQICVRKVSAPRLRVETMSIEPDDPENTSLSYLKEEARKADVPLSYIMHLIDAHHILTLRPSDDPERWSRISFSKYYNSVSNFPPPSLPLRAVFTSIFTGILT